MENLVLAQTKIVILNYNGLHFLKQFLPSVINFSKGAVIVVADNASTDGSVEWIKSHYSEVEILVFEKNWGFCEGYNRALSQLEAKYFLLLNSDVEVTENWLNPLVDFLEKNEDYVAVQPKIRSWHDKSKFEFAGAAGGFMDEWGFLFCRGRLFDVLEEDKGQYDEVAPEIFWASGAAMFVRAEKFKTFGGFDKDFFAHFEEVDLCWRWQNAGLKIGFVPQSVVFHVGGGTLPQGTYRKTFLNFRNNLVMMIKNLPAKGFFRKMFLRLCLDGLASVRFLMRGKFDLFLAVGVSHLYLYENVFSLIKKRKAIQSKYPCTDLPKSTFRASVVFAHFFKKIQTYADLKKN